MDNPLQSMAAPFSRRLRRLYWSIGILLAVLACVGLLYPSIRNHFSFGSGHTANSAELTPAVNALNTNDFTSALHDVDAILASNPKDTQALLLKATILAQQGSIEFKENDGGAKAIAIANQVLAINPSSDEAYRIIGYASEIMQQYAAAHAAYAKALALNPKNAGALADDGHAYDLQGNYASAEKDYRAAVALDPTLDLPRMGLVRILLREHKTDEAQTILKAVIATTTNVRTMAEAYYMSGLIAGIKNQYAQSGELMRQAIGSDPTYALAYEGLGRELFLEAVDRSTSLTPTQRATLVNQSYASLAQAAKLNPNQSSVYYQLGVELLTVGQKNAGLQMLAKAKETVPLDISLSSSDKVVLLKQIQAVLATS